MDTPSVRLNQVNDDANLRLVRFFGICLSSLVFVYALLGVRLFLAGNSFAVADWFMVALRVLAGGAALAVIFYPPWLARPLERQVAAMGALFETSFASADKREKIRLIVLVTMVSLLL